MQTTEHQAATGAATNAATGAEAPTTIRVEIPHRWRDTPVYVADLPADTPSGMRVRAALEQATVRGAVLSGADLRGAVLSGADLRGAVLSGAVLRGAGRMWDTTGNLREVKSLQIERWSVTYTATHMQIGCQLHALERWWAMSDKDISALDSEALAWWGRWKPLLQQIVSMSPAVPGGTREA